MQTHFLLTGLTHALGMSTLKALGESYPYATFSLLVPKGKKEEVALRCKDIRKDLSCQFFPCDLRAMDLGLPLEQYEQLKSTVTHLLHLDYAPLGANREEFLEGNVVSTENITYFAKQTTTLKHYIYLGSLFLTSSCDTPLPEETLEENQGFSSLYAKSRFVAEDAVRSEMHRNPTSIVRVGFLVGDTKTGAMHPFQEFYQLLLLTRYLKKLPFLLPSLKNTGPVCLTAIDHAVEALCALVDTDQKGVYHIRTPLNESAREVFRALCKKTNASIPWNPLYTLLRGISKDFFVEFQKERRISTEKGDALVPFPYVDEKVYLERLLTYYQEHPRQ